MGKIDIELIKAMYDAETNPARKQIYANHLLKAEELPVVCSACEIDEPLIVPVNQIDEE